MDKLRMIRIFSQLIAELCEKDDKDFTLLAMELEQKKKIKFRKFERTPGDENRLRSYDITVEI